MQKSNNDKNLKSYNLWNHIDGLLVDHQIEILAKNNCLIKPFEKICLSGCSYDLRVGSNLSSRNRQSSFDLNSESYIIESGECITIETMEYIDFKDLPFYGLISNKHSILAKGVFHPITSIDPGFKGPLAITIFNSGHTKYEIRKGDKIAKLFIGVLKNVPNLMYGTTQRPTYKEGSTEISLIINNPNKEIDGLKSIDLYGESFKELCNKVSAIEKNIELGLLKKEKERRKTLYTFILGIIAAVVGKYLWSYLQLFFHK